MQCLHIYRLAEPAIENIFFKCQHIAGVVELVPDRDELAGFLCQLLQLACALHRGTDRLFRQHVGAVRQAGDNLCIMQMDRRGDYC